MEKLKRLPDNVKSGTSDEKSQCQDTSAVKTKHPMKSEKKSCKRLACMAIPRKRSKVTTMDSWFEDSGSHTDYQSASKQNDGEQEYDSPLSDRDSSQNDSPDNSGAEPETSQDDSQTSSWDSFHNSRDSAEDSHESDTELSPPPPIDNRKKFNKSRGDECKDKSQRYKKKEDSFVAPKFSMQDRKAANDSITHATKQVKTSVYLDPKAKRTTGTLYVGNLDFSTSDEDLYLALFDSALGWLRMENVTIPRVNGRSKYGFVEFSWPRGALLDLADICIRH